MMNHMVCRKIDFLPWLNGEIAKADKKEKRLEKGRLFTDDMKDDYTCRQYRGNGKLKNDSQSGITNQDSENE